MRTILNVLVELGVQPGMSRRACLRVICGDHMGLPRAALLLGQASPILTPLDLGRRLRLRLV